MGDSVLFVADNAESISWKACHYEDELMDYCLNSRV